MQNTYLDNPVVGLAGMHADAGDKRVESYLCIDQTPLQFGRGAALGTEDAEKVMRNMYQEIGTITFSADLVADDDVDVSVNGDAITTVSYATSHAATMTAIAAAIDGLTGVSASVTAARVITVTRRVLQAETSADILLVAGVTSGGAGTATVALAYSTDQVFAGIVAHKQNEDGYIDNKETGGVFTQGVVFGELVTSQTPSVGGAVYVVSKGDTNRGKFTTVNDTTTELVSGAVFKGAAFVDGTKTLCKIEINKP